MSEQNESDSISGDSILDTIERWYHIPALVMILVVMFWSRAQAYGNFIVDGEVYFRGNDPWYHFRETMFLLENYPNLMPFDPWTGFPEGVSQGVFGTLWDHITALLIIAATPITGGGEEGAMRVMLLMGPIFGAAVAIPTYFIARRFVDRLSAVAAVLVLGLLPGSFFSYTLVGFYDHHAGEVFFQTLAVLAFLVAFAVAEREHPVWELIVDRDWAGLKRPAAYAAAAGVALGLYMWTWQPGVLMVGFTGIFLAIKITSDVYHGESPEPIAFAGAVSMTVAGLMQLLSLDELTFGVTGSTLTQVVLPLGVAAGCVFLGWLARTWERRDIDASKYPPTVGGLIVLSAGLLAVVLPSAWSTISSNLIRRIAFSGRDTTQTIGEATPPLSDMGLTDFVLSQYGLAFFLALAAVLYIIARPLIRSNDTNRTLYVLAAFAVVGSVYVVPDLYGAVGGLVGVSWQTVGLGITAAFIVGATFLGRHDTEELYFVVWAVFITSMAFTQVRFNYYLAIIVAVGAGYFLQVALDAIDLNRSLTTLREIEGWQAMAAVTLVIVLVGPLVFAVTPVWAAGASTGPGTVTQWDDSLEWLSNETPHPGEFGGANNAMEYYGTYERPADGDFDYPEGAYGVQSWWDYGHWITTLGERIPNANPFQQGATEAANYLLAPSEERAESVLEQTTDDGDEGQTRYVIVDWEMVEPNAKFGAPIVFYDDGNLSQQDFFEGIYRSTEQGPVFDQLLTKQRYYDSQMVRLYKYHGSAVDPGPVVVEWENGTIPIGDGQQITYKQIPAGQESPIRTFNTTAEAQAYVEANENAQLGGIGAIPTERVEALEHYRLVKASESSALSSNQFLQQQLQTIQRTGLGTNELSPTDPHWVKIFERVPGATVQGSGAPAGAEVRATVEMKVPEGGQALTANNGQITFTRTNGTFTCTQYATADQNGNFEMTLPYSTTGYENFGPENGYTNVSVRATGPYTFSATGGEGGQFSGQAAVNEAKVVGVDESPVTVELSSQ